MFVCNEWIVQISILHANRILQCLRVRLHLWNRRAVFFFHSFHHPTSLSGKASTALSWQVVIRLVSVPVSECGGAVVRAEGPGISVEADPCQCDPWCLQSELDVVILLLVYYAGQASVALPVVLALKGLREEWVSKEVYNVNQNLIEKCGDG